MLMPDTTVAVGSTFETMVRVRSEVADILDGQFRPSPAVISLSDVISGPESFRVPGLETVIIGSLCLGSHNTENPCRGRLRKRDPVEIVPSDNPAAQTIRVKSGHLMVSDPPRCRPSLSDQFS